MASPAERLTIHQQVRQAIVSVRHKQWFRDDYKGGCPASCKACFSWAELPEDKKADLKSIKASLNKKKNICFVVNEQSDEDEDKDEGRRTLSSGLCDLHQEQVTWRNWGTTCEEAVCKAHEWPSRSQAPLLYVGSTTPTQAVILLHFGLFKEEHVDQLITKDFNVALFVAHLMHNKKGRLHASVLELLEEISSELVPVCLGQLWDEEKQTSSNDKEKEDEEKEVEEKEEKEEEKEEIESVKSSVNEEAEEDDESEEAKETLSRRRARQSGDSPSRGLVASKRARKTLKPKVLGMEDEEKGKEEEQKKEKEKEKEEEKKKSNNGEKQPPAAAGKGEKRKKAEMEEEDEAAVPKDDDRIERLGAGDSIYIPNFLGQHAATKASFAELLAFPWQTILPDSSGSGNKPSRRQKVFFSELDSFPYLDNDIVNAKIQDWNPVVEKYRAACLKETTKGSPALNYCCGIHFPLNRNSMPAFKEDVANLVEGSSIYILTFRSDCDFEFSSDPRHVLKPFEPSKITLKPRSLLILGPNTLKKFEIHFLGDFKASPKKNDAPRVLLAFKSVKAKSDDDSDDDDE